MSPRGARRAAFTTSPSPSGAAIVAAGPIASFLLAIAIFAALAYFNGKQVLEPRRPVRGRGFGRTGGRFRGPGDLDPVDQRTGDLSVFPSFVTFSGSSAPLCGR